MTRIEMETIGLDNARLAATRDALDLIGIAALFFDGEGRVVGCNAGAEMLFAGDPAEGRTSTPGARDWRRLQTAVASAIRSGRGPLAEGGVVPLARRDGRCDVVVRLRVLAADEADPGTIRAIGLIADPEEERPHDRAGRARLLFGLTATEARIADLLARGEDLTGIAEITGISYQTARTHLRNIFDKTETSRQGQLVALLNRLTP